ncbi:hypothetical protein [Marmoricola sp. RAF53]|uniref:hypothetical protein n=1 Tax=Marmoricola sp. RAF53 TaxID=3233059 RepID=UPI003F98D1CB
MLAALVFLVACSTSHSASEKAKAQQLVAATESADVAPGLTVQAAEALYGSSAPQLCDALDDGISTAEQLLLTGNPSGRRGKLVTDDAITYGRLVVQTYCPKKISEYDDLVDDIDGTEVTR